MTEVGGNPTVYVMKALRKHATFFLNSAVNLLGSMILELLNDHVQHFYAMFVADYLMPKYRLD
jgi:hypothetical protein